MSIKIKLGYPYDPAGETFKGLSQVQLIYDFFKYKDGFEIAESDDGPVDIFLFFNGGPPARNQGKYWKKGSSFLQKLGVYYTPIGVRSFRKRNSAAEDALARLRKRNPKMKIIHRLDDRYLLLCKNYGYEETVSAVNRIADATIIQSKYGGSIYSNEVDSIFGKLPPLNLKNPYLIYNGVERSIFHEQGETLELPGKIRIVHVAATGMPRKGLSTVLIIAELLRGNKDIHFYLIGNQPSDPLSGYLIKRLNNVTHIPMISDRRELAKYLRSMDILLFPSRNDCAPNVVLEAMSCGLAVVAHDSGGTPELIIKEDLQAGLLLHEANPIQSLKIVLENLDHFKRNAIEIIKKHHSMEHVGSQYAKVIRCVVKG
jgi:glycosyltransferase involved in cell wall biosynthesis